MEDIFRGQRAGAPVTFAAKVATTFAPATICRACDGSVLRGYGNHFCSGTAAVEFRQAGYVRAKSRQFNGPRSGTATCGQGNSGYGEVFNGHHLYGLRGAIRYQRRFKHAENIIDKPYAENRIFP